MFTEKFHGVCGYPCRMWVIGWIGPGQLMTVWDWDYVESFPMGIVVELQQDTIVIDMLSFHPPPGSSLSWRR